MALPTSGPLSLNDIKGEFGGPTSPSLGDYYAGGSYVPSGTSGTNGPVPSSGAINISNFYGTSSVAVNFNDRYIYAGNSGATAIAGYQINSNGYDYEGINGAYSTIAQWVTPTSAASNYEVYATVTSGVLTSGTAGSWVAVSGNPTWTRNRASVGINTTVLDMQIRAIGTTTVLDTWTVTLEAERF